MNEMNWLGTGLRAALSLAVLFFSVGVASRMCTGTQAWRVTTAGFAALFLYLALSVVPQPSEAGLLYSIEWGVGGAALYSLGQAMGWLEPSRFQKRRAESAKSEED
ncbi:MAG: hypothetical protein ACJZ7Z_05790 [Myxococcota bacterium]|nr:hypothetical protein [Spirochaeta sp.]RPG06419.1 MAG: hypothetical protein CBC32_011745 [Proteobacteria bacterium TMED72]